MTPVEESVLPFVHLSPGELLVTREPQMVSTVLGSCVAVTMFDRKTGLASICHAMLAHPPPTARMTADSPFRFRYVSFVIPIMLGIYQRAGIDPTRIIVKIFGGGHVLARCHRCEHGPHIGQDNVREAREWLDRAGVSISAERTGGGHGCKILFNTATGEVLHKRLKNGNQ